MKTELTDISGTRKEIKIEIEPAEVRSAYDHVSQQYTKGANVPGFRPGHAPTSVVRTRYKSEIRSEVLRDLLPEAVHKAIVEHSLDVLGEPEVEFDNTQEVDPSRGTPLTLKITVEVIPEIKLETYKGLEAVRRTRPITDEDVERMINGLRDASASLQPVEDRASDMGDNVTINALGHIIDEPEALEIKVDDIEVVIGGPGVMEEFSQNLTGVKPDDKRTFVVDYPADYNSAGLAGKKVEYAAEVTAVRHKELPEIDDEWARSLGGDFDSVEALKARVREDLEHRSTAESDRAVRDEVIRKLLDAHKFEVPQSLIERQADQRLRVLAQEMVGRGINPQSEDINWEGAHAEMQVQAEADVRASMLLETISIAENIDVSEEEVEAEIQALATGSRQPIEQVRAALTKDGGERSIAHRLRNRKALELLVENANITETEWTEPKEAEAEAEAEPKDE